MWFQKSNYCLGEYCLISSNEEIVCLLPPSTAPPSSFLCFLLMLHKQQQAEQATADSGIRRDLLKEWGRFVICPGLLGHMESLPAIPTAP